MTNILFIDDEHVGEVATLLLFWSRDTMSYFGQ